MKIAHVAPVFLPHKSGMANAAFMQCRELARLGHVVTVFTPRYSFDAPASERIDEICVRRIMPIFTWGNAASVPSLLWRLRRFDVVQLHYPFFGGAEWVWLAKRLGIIKKLVLYYHMDAQVSGWQGIVARSYERCVLSPLIRAADRIAVSSMDYFEHSRLVTQFYCGRNKIALREKIVEVPLGIDEQKFKIQNSKFKVLELRKSLNISEGQKVVLFVGGMDRPHYFKGVDVLLKAFALLVSDEFAHNGESMNLKHVLVGDGDQRSVYEHMVKDLNIEQHVQFVGRVSDVELPLYYHLADVMVLPSINSAEAFGIVILESLACGTPVIASDLPGVRTLIRSGRNGYLAKAGDVGELAEKMRFALSAERLSDTREIRLDEKYTIKNAGLLLDRIYRM